MGDPVAARAAPAPGRAGLREVTGAREAVYRVPGEQVTATVDVGPWMKQKISAVLAHRSEVERVALPG
ncbi:hypothetical protein ACFW4M_31885 [Streptomyces sp. NPDC058794]|uniref:hypothetical protein n=1 Tax=Streptomyces sp. NPDC058794 TaxID=3346636 RepID=UPI00367A1A38